MKKPTTRIAQMGVCLGCQNPFSKAQMTRHLKACLSQAKADGAAKVQQFHLVIEGLYLPEYWMHVAISGARPLRDLDHFLRNIWLECCGHLSGFTINNIRYESAPSEEKLFGGPPDQSMAAKLYKVLEVGTKFTYEYDYGSTTDLALRVINVFEAPVGRRPVQILARNLPPQFKCAGCKLPATQLAEGGNGLDPDNCYCEDCAKELDEEEQEMLMPIVNSPRVDVCGYCG